MKKIVKVSSLAVTMTIAMLLFDGCSTVPITGRKQLNLVSDSEMMNMSFNQYDQFLKENKLSTNKEQVEMVKRCGKRIAAAVEKYMADNGYSSHIQGFDWEFNLVDEDIPNAWCMPGGKVVFYTGILPFTQNEEGLAVVMGHEIAHAVAKHGNERMSNEMAVQMGGTALSVAVDEKPEETKAIYMAAFGLGAQYGFMLPYSRTHETEADKMGLIFMAMAGYNPEEAVQFWGRMAASGGQKPPEFMSTHPADDTRIKNLQAYMPEALKYYKK
ncbi:M48 family metallopeptidase [Carboxylicivirga sp. M1479]|uniref:M48 family metallopeptidase n=1 Tax=Carboxylicivirga sp. M1479 TaxID=2594476 RepID=UPI001178572A|nr:M48 family metallopeptidase [Carboxylicivirga sp. M1479]TRX70765.1 M48 family metallopeptidase [Carboxylicivirga sp. M1479]